MARRPDVYFICNNPITQAQVEYQTGVALPIIRPNALYLDGASWSPVRVAGAKEILLIEPRDGCILPCILSHILDTLAPEDFPFVFHRKMELDDRSYERFSQFWGVLLYPHDLALMSFYEFHVMGVPIFMPGHLSKYIFPWSASVHFYDGSFPDIGFPVNGGVNGTGTEHPFSPFGLHSHDALEYWVPRTDFFVFPAVTKFYSLGDLITILLDADFAAISQQMNKFSRKRLAADARSWSHIVSGITAAAHRQLEVPIKLEDNFQ